MRTTSSKIDIGDIGPGEHRYVEFVLPEDTVLEDVQLGGECPCGGKIVPGRKPRTFVCEKARWYNRKKHAMLEIENLSVERA
jgi:hypothetical protein